MKKIIFAVAILSLLATGCGGPPILSTEEVILEYKKCSDAGYYPDPLLNVYGEVWGVSCLKDKPND